MAYCRDCGAYIPEGFDVCPACGKSVNEAASQAQAQAAQAEPKKAAEERKDESSYREAADRAAREASAKAEELRRRIEGEADKRRSRRSGADRYYSGNDGDTTGASKYAGEYKDDAEENKTLGLLCYLGPLFLIPLLSKPDSQFLRYHCNQGLVLMLYVILASIGSNIPVIGWMISVFGWITGISWFFKGLSNVREGKRSPLPVIGSVNIIK